MISHDLWFPLNKKQSTKTHLWVKGQFVFCMRGPIFVSQLKQYKTKPLILSLMKKNTRRKTILKNGHNFGLGLNFGWPYCTLMNTASMRVLLSITCVTCSALICDTDGVAIFLDGVSFSMVAVPSIFPSETDSPTDPIGTCIKEKKTREWMKRDFK